MKRSPRSTRRSAKGFNLLELMVGITVLGLLLGIGVPSMTRMIRSNAISAQTNDLISALTLARSEAAKRGIRVTLCPSDSEQSACQEDGSWTGGWLLFTDDIEPAGTVDEDDTILQAWAPASPGFHIDTAAESVSFLPARAVDDAEFEIYKPGCGTDEKRRVTLDGIGRVQVQKEDC